MKESKSRRASSSKGKPFAAQRILVPVDFSDPSRSALKYAGTLAREFGGRLILLYVVERVATPDFAYHPLMKEPAEVTAQAEHALTTMCEDEGIDESAVEKVLVRQGVAHSQVTETAKTLKADLIVIATHGNTGLKHVLLGSTTERVVRHAPCPVLVVRA